MSDYKLELHTGPVIRTHWWKDLDDAKAPANVWWLTGGGLSRPPTDVELDFWKRGEEFRKRAEENAAEQHCEKLCYCKRKPGHEGGCNTTRGDEAAVPDCDGFPISWPSSPSRIFEQK